MFTPGQRRVIGVSVVIGIIAIVVALRLSIGNRPLPAPTPTPPSSLEQYFTFKVVSPNIDPIIQERERKSFDVLVEALRKDPDLFDGWISLGQTKKMMGDFAGAAEIWEYAGFIRPSTSLAFQNLGDLYANFLNDYPKAESHFRTAITNSRGEEKNAMFYLSLFDLYRYRFNDPVKAMAALEEGVGRNDWSFGLNLKAARYAAEVGEREKALAFYGAAVKLAPQDRELAAEYRKYRDGR